MKSIVLVALALAAVAVAAPTEPVQIVRSDYVKNPEGPYNFNYETADGSKRDETGELKDALDEDNKPHPVIVVRGFYSYVNDEGKPELVNYYADETGYHAEGESIPKPARR